MRETGPRNRSRRSRKSARLRRPFFLLLGIEPLEVRALLTVTHPFDLANLLPENGGGGSLGTTLSGQNQKDHSARIIGDVNGDGFDDLVVGVPTEYGHNVEQRVGNSFVIFGKAQWSATPLRLFSTTFDGTNGFTLFGVNASDFSGSAVSDAGDVNGDGFDDLLIGARLADAAGNAKSDAGESYVVFGKADWSTTPELDLVTLNGTNGFTIYGASQDDQSGSALNKAGDVNGDGYDDLLIGAHFGERDASPPSLTTNAGESYVVFGKADWSATPTLDLAALDGTNGITLFGVDRLDESGFAVSGAGDVNGDGFDDLLIGAYRSNGLGNAKSLAGESYVVFGKPVWSATPTLELASIDGTNGFTLFGSDPSDLSGHSVSAAGDVNGDGFDDLAIGTNGDGEDEFQLNVGETSVVFGKADWSATPNFELDSLNGTNGFTVVGIDSSDYSGQAVSGAGDVNGDGFDDLLIGAPHADAAGNAKLDAGESYVVFCKSDWSATPTFNLSALNGMNGFTLFGVDTRHGNGSGVHGGGDVNGDGFDDLIITALGNPGTTAGQSYLLFGGDFTDSVTHPGTSGNDALTGTASANVMNGAAGDDILLGNGGADVMYAGPGDDILAVTDIQFARIDGGNGTDILRLDGSGLSLNLTLSTSVVNRLSSIEGIDIRGSGANTLVLNPQQLLGLSNLSNTLSIKSNSDDTVTIGTGWKLVTTAVENGGFIRVMSNQGATARILGPLDWTNPSNRLDVNANGSVEPIDVLIVINELNDPRFSISNQLVPAASLATFPGFFYDTTADGKFVVPQDALVIINFLNGLGGSGEGEGAEGGFGVLPTFGPTASGKDPVSGARQPVTSRGSFAPQQLLIVSKQQLAYAIPSRTISRSLVIMQDPAGLEEILDAISGDVSATWNSIRPD